MDILDIIKESFVFPSKELGKLAIYIVFTIIISGVAVGGILTSILSAVNYSSIGIVGIILFICALILGFILSGYQLSIIKSGIDQSESLSDYQWKENLINGVKNLILTIVYYIIPAIIVLIVGFATNVPGNFYQVLQESITAPVNGTIAANTTVPAVNTVSTTLMSNLVSSISITALVTIIVFLIFSFIQTMGLAKLAKTESLSESLNMVEAFKDIGRIGYGKVIAVIILIAIISIVINGILGLIYGYVPQLSILSVIVSPYLIFFASRAIGLLYSDIA